MIDLSKYQSECGAKQKIIICKDKGPCQYFVSNMSEKEVLKYTVDDNVIKDGTRCDFLLMDLKSHYRLQI